MRLTGLRRSALLMLALPGVALAAPGDLDTTFGGTGTVVTVLTAGSDMAWGVVAQPDGRIVAAGVMANANQDFAVVRHDAAGALDGTFGTGGIVSTNFGFGTQNDVGRALLLQPDGKLVVAGNARGPSNTNDFGLARYNTDGSLDAGFGTGGKVLTAIGTGNETPNALTRQPDGKLIAAGFSTIAGNVDMALVRYNGDGSLDGTFGGGGIVTTAVGTSTDNANAVAVQPDGKIVAAGYGTTGTVLDIAVVRYNADGSLDGTFGTGGKVTTAVGPGYAISNALVIQPDGKLVVAGYTTNGANYDFALVRYNTDGSLDGTFGVGGKVTTAVGVADDQARALLLQSDGKLVVGGYTTSGTNSTLVLAKYTTNGGLDAAFGTGGIVTTTISAYDGSNALALQADGKIVAAGFTGTQASTNLLTARYLNAVCGNGALEGGEACDAGGANGTPGSCCSAACTLVTAGTECRASAGDCDVAETCTGASAACPADALAPGSTVCRPGSGDSCDPSETCTGSSPTCPADVVAPGGTVCRTGSGDLCDPTETCTGVAGQPCPADSVSGAFVTCRPAAGTCDVAENCPGTAGQPCPADTIVTAGTECRASGGACDLAESCDGVNAACPADAKSTAVCRTSAGICDVAEVCDGVTNACPTDAFQPAATVCRSPVDACDLPETCTGSGATCPADTGLPDTDADTVCDALDNCDAVANTDQANGDADALGDACDPCTNSVPTTPSKTKLILSKLLPPAGDDTLNFKGFFLDVPATPPIAPAANGLRILVTDATGATPIDITLPGGAYDAVQRAGWKVNGSGTAWKYANAGSPVPLVNGVRKAQVKAYPSTPGKYKFAVKGKAGSYAVNTANLPLTGTLVIQPPNAVDGQCGETAFLPPPNKPNCTVAGGGKTVKCK